MISFAVIVLVLQRSKLDFSRLRLLLEATTKGQPLNFHMDT
jgi:hypothetical protein